MSAGGLFIVPAVTATITGYGVGLFIHILAVVVGLGTTFGYGFFMAFAERNAPRSIPAVYRASQLSDRFLVTPALIVILVAGIYLLSDGPYSASDSWVSVGFLAILILFGMIHGYLGPRTRKGIEVAERDLASGDTLSPEFEAISRQLRIGGQIAGLVIAVTIFFMTVKP